MEDYMFNIGQFRGKTIQQISQEENGLQKLQNHRKTLMNFIRKPHFERHRENNERELKIVEDFLLAHGQELINFEESDLSKKTFKELVKIFEDKILENYDVKFKKKNLIRNEYKDYLCLKCVRVTYVEILEKQNTQLITQVIKSM